MKNKLQFLPLLSLFFLLSCSVEPAPIQYGEDHCHFCDMTVVDKTHASEYTTKKGKSYVFDAIECMVREINRENNENELAYILVADYANPGSLIDAKQAYFLISKEIKSPMGANLSAFSSQKIAEDYQKKHTGTIYTWQELKQQFQ